MTSGKHHIHILLITLSFLTLFVKVNAQDKDVIQFSGVVVGKDSTNGLPGVHLFLPESGRGTTSNLYGYFSLPVETGDTLLISSVGYQRRTVVVPKTEEQSITLVIELVEDTTVLDEIEIFPYPTEELFKEAILTLELPYQDDLDNMNEWLRSEQMKEMYKHIPMSANANHRYFMDLQIQAIQDKFQPRTNPLLNPFAWARFIQSIKKGDLKNKN